jgi:hypothetical protein
LHLLSALLQAELVKVDCRSHWDAPAQAPSLVLNRFETASARSQTLAPPQWQAATNKVRRSALHASF